MTQAQLEFPDPRSWGGRRRKAGRPKRKQGVAHAARERVTRHDPRLVTVKLASGLPSLLTRTIERLITARIRAAQKSDFRIVHYTIQSNHLHLIIEADDSKSLASGMKGLLCRIVPALNRLWCRRGKLFPERFHDRVLRSLRQVRNALKYVLNNHLKHGAVPVDSPERAFPDPFSSGRYFDGWSHRPRELEPGTPEAVVAAPGWKISIGWKQHYDRIPLDAAPA